MLFWFDGVTLSKVRSKNDRTPFSDMQCSLK